MSCRLIVCISVQQPPQALHQAALLLQATLRHFTGEPLCSFDDSATYVIPVFERADLDFAFRAAHQIAEHRQAFQAGSIVLINPKLMLPDPVTTDFEELGCRVVFSDEPQAISQNLSLLACAAHRVRKRGPAIRWREGSAPLVSGSGGRSVAVALSYAEERVLRALMSSRLPIPPYELADLSGCSPSEIRVYVQRIRNKFLRAWRAVGIRPSAVIETCSSDGYRLCMRVLFK